MDTSLLRLFVEVMRRGSFAAVARDYNVAPSSISRSIATIEKDLGVRLFQRTTRRLSATEAGEVFFARVSPILDNLDAAHQAAKDAGKQPEGLLRVLAPVGFAQTNVIPLLPEFTQRYPGLTFEFILTDEELDLVSERIDVAIRIWPFAKSSYIAHKLCTMNAVVCASPRYVETNPLKRPQDLAMRRCILFRQTGYRSEWRFRDAEGHVTTVPVQPLCIVSNALTLKECAIRGLGPALVPKWIIGTELHDGALVNVFPDLDVTATEFGVASAWVLFASKTYVPLKIRVLLDFLKSKFKHGAPGELSAARRVIAKRERRVEPAKVGGFGS
jgi:DNA-binding transcriptional LysR family regulator